MHLKKYFSIIRQGFLQASAYRFNAVMGVVASVLYLVMLYAIWGSISSAGELSGSLSQVLTYILVGQVISNSVFVSVEDFLGDKIREGTIVNELKRPISLRSHIYFYKLGETAFNTVARSLPILGLGIIFLDLQTPSLQNGLFFLVSLFLSFNLVFSFSFLTSMLIFWTKIGWGIRAMRSNIQQVFSGVLFPLYLLPGFLVPIFDSLPFKWMADGPIRIFLMQATSSQIYNILFLQLAWTIVFIILSSLAWKIARKKLTIQGG